MRKLAYVLAKQAAEYDQQRNMAMADIYSELLMKLAAPYWDEDNDEEEDYDANNPPRLQGEYMFYPDSSYIDYADGDVGDVNHDMLAQAHIISKHDFTPLDNYLHDVEGPITKETMSEAYDRYMEDLSYGQQGEDPSEWLDNNHDFVDFMIDKMGHDNYNGFSKTPKEWGVMKYDLIAVRQHHCDVNKFDENTKARLVSGLEEAYGSKARKGIYTIHEFITGKTLTGITFEQLETPAHTGTTFLDEQVSPYAAPFRAQPSNPTYKDWRA